MCRTVTDVGFGVGAINALVGSGTLITFPTLVASAIRRSRPPCQMGRSGGRWCLGHLGLSRRAGRSVGSVAVADPGAASRRRTGRVLAIASTREGFHPDRASAVDTGSGAGCGRAADSVVGTAACRGAGAVTRRRHTGKKSCTGARYLILSASTKATSPPRRASCWSA